MVLGNLVRDVVRGRWAPAVEPGPLALFPVPPDGTREKSGGNDPIEAAGEQHTIVAPMENHSFPHGHRAVDVDQYLEAPCLPAPCGRWIHRHAVDVFATHASEALVVDGPPQSTIRAMTNYREFRRI